MYSLRVTLAVFGLWNGVTRGLCLRQCTVGALATASPARRA